MIFIHNERVVPTIEKGAESSRTAFVVVALYCLCIITSQCAPGAASRGIPGSITKPSSMPVLHSVPLAFPKPTPPSVREAAPVLPQVKTIAIIVQDSLFSSISSAVSVYRQDLEDSGYNTTICTEPISTAQVLKEKLVKWYGAGTLMGAVLIGRLPYALFHHSASGDFGAETFICDLYLMDLDGIWGETGSPDGIYETHSGNIRPEVFVGRIDPTCLSWGSGPAAHINEYLSRLHSYRIGGLERSHRALVYVDDDWSGYWGIRWDSDVGCAFSNRTFVDSPSMTNADDWLNNRLSQDYQWTHICVHSSADTHYFGPDGSGEGTATSNQIRAVPPSFNFYNLFACSGARWTVPDNLAVSYTFTGPYSVAAVGSTKTGSMMDCEYFYAPLHENVTLGESLVDWFSNSLSISSSAGSLYVQWYYGMAIIGDPLLTLVHDCTVLPPMISSPTHPDSASWSMNPRPQFNWSVPVDVNGIAGYYYVLDRQPFTVPNSKTGTYTTANGTQTSVELGDGVYYLHVVAKDSVGNVGKTAAHYRVNIDRTAPSICIVSPLALFNSSTSSISVTWAPHDALSGYASSEVWVDNASNIVYSGALLTTTLNDLTEGQHVVNVTIFDAAGNRANNQTVFDIDLTDPTVDITNPSNGAHVGASFVVSWEAYDAETGCRRAEVRIDGLLKALVFSPQTTIQISGLDPGVHSLVVSVFDWANRTASDEVYLTTEESPLKFLLLGASIGSISVIAVAVLLRRRADRAIGRDG